MSQIEPEALYDYSRIQAVAVAPSGERIAFLTQEFDPDNDESVNSLWTVPADGSTPPYRLTRASEATSPKWSPDGSRLGFIATRDRDVELQVGKDDDDKTGNGDSSQTSDDPDNGTDDEGDEDESVDETDAEANGESDGDGDEETSQVWAFDLDRGGDARQVTDLAEGVQAFDWSPDGTQFVVAARDPTESQQEYLDALEEDGPIVTERLQHKVDGKGYLDEVTTYLFIVDVDTREARRLDEANDGGYDKLQSLDPAWGPDGRIAYGANHTDHPDDNWIHDVYVIDPDGGEPQRISDGLACRAFTWSPNGEYLAFAGDDPENAYLPTEVYVSTGEGDYRSLSGNLDRTLAWFGGLEWIDDESLVAVIGDRGRSRLATFHVRDGPERVFDGQNDYESLATMDVGGDTMAFQTTNPADGSDIDVITAGDLAYDGAGEDPRTRVTAINRAFIENHDGPGCRKIEFEGARGDEVEAYVSYPADFDPDAPTPRGLILQIHGGPMAYDRPAFRFGTWYFTSRGYLVCQVNYHGSTSYGSDFATSLRGNWGTLEVDDLIAAVDTLVEREWADPDRLFPTGFSQGGVNTAYLVTQDSRWAAAAAEHGVYDFRSDFGTADTHAWTGVEFGLPWEEPEQFDAISSITDVDNVETPLLVTAGEHDWRCPPTQAEQLYVAVRKQGVDAKLVIYQNEHHNVGDPDRAIHRLETIDEWFARYDPGRESP